MLHAMIWLLLIVTILTAASMAIVGVFSVCPWRRPEFFLGAFPAIGVILYVLLAWFLIASFKSSQGVSLDALRSAFSKMVCPFFVSLSFCFVVYLIFLVAAGQHQIGRAHV